MNVIKEYCKRDGWAVIRTDTYAHGLAHFLRLFDEAQKDSPKLTPERVRVIHFGGERYSGTWGIEFPATEKPSPEYRDIEQLELTR